MRTLIVGFSTIVIMLISSPVFAQVTVEEDEFTGEVTIKSEDPRIIPNESDNVRRSLGLVIYSKPHYGMAIYAMSNDETVFDYSTDTAYFLLDEERMEVSVDDTSMDYNSGSITSTATMIFDRKQFSRLADAKVARVKIGNSVFQINEPLRSDMKEIIAKADN